MAGLTRVSGCRWGRHLERGSGQIDPVGCAARRATMSESSGGHGRAPSRSDVRGGQRPTALAWPAARVPSVRAAAVAASVGLARSQSAPELRRPWPADEARAGAGHAPTRDARVAPTRDGTARGKRPA